MISTAVIYRTHFWDDFAQRQFDRLLWVAADTEVFILVDETAGPVHGIAHDKVVRTTEAALLSRGLAQASEGNLLWFNGDYPLYRFYELHPGFDAYLQLEYDVVINRPIAGMMEEAARQNVDFIALTKGEPVQDWFWRKSWEGLCEMSELRWQLVCLSAFSNRALAYLWQRRLELSGAYAKGNVKVWPIWEAFLPTELSRAGFNCRELSDYGSVEAYDHWPPYVEADIPGLAKHDFLHSVLDEKRYAASMLEYHVGLAGYINPASLFHRKLRRLPTRRYLSVVASTFWSKARRSLKS
jgi:hypothetical protein